MRKFFLLINLFFFASDSFSQVIIKMRKEGGVSTIPCKVNGLNLRFIFDTGASDVSISMTEASFMLKNDYLSKDDIIGKSNYIDAKGDITEGVNIILREVEIGGMKLYNIKASVVTNLKAPLLLGQSAISKLGIVQLDLVANTLTILNRNDSVMNSKDQSDNILTSDSANVVEVIKSDHELLLDQAWSYFNDGNYQQSLSYCDKIIVKDSKNSKAYFLRAISYDYLEDYNSAIKDYSKLIQLDPKDHVAYCYRGKSKYDLKDYNGALSDLNSGLSLNPKYLVGYKWRAETKNKLNNLQGAILDYDKAISIDQLDSSLYIDRAFLKNEVNNYAGAIVDCNKAISINSTYPRAYYCRGVTKRYQKDFSGAMNDLNQAIELDPEMAEPYAVRGSIKELQYEDNDGALEDYNKALEIDPDYIYASLLKKLLEKKMENNVWIKVGSSKDGDNWYIYNSVASKEYSTIKLWAKNEFKSYTTKKNGKSLTYTNGYTLMLCLFHCGNKEYKILSIKNYDSKGNIINSDDFGEYEDWKTPAPQTVIEIVLNEACKKYN